MVTVNITEKGGQTETLQFDKPEITIGRVQSNDIVLPKANVSKRHAKILNESGSIVVVDAKSTNGTYINGNRIDAPYDWQDGDRIFVGDYTLELETDAAKDEPVPPPPPDDEESAETQTRADPQLDAVLEEDEWAGEGEFKDEWSDEWDENWDDGSEPLSTQENFDDQLSDLVNEASANASAEPDTGDVVGEEAHAERVVDDAMQAPLDDPGNEPLADAKAGLEAEPLIEATSGVEDSFQAGAAADKAEPLIEAKSGVEDSFQNDAEVDEPEPLIEAKSAVEESTSTRPASSARSASQRRPDSYALASRTVHDRLIESLDLRRLSVEDMGDEELRSRTREAVEDIVSGMVAEAKLPSDVDPQELIETVLNEALGLGPLEDLLEDDSVTEIIVNGPHQIYVERAGRLQNTGRAFSSSQAVLGVIERIVAPIGRRIDESSPMVDGRLRDGSRVNAIIPPLAINGPCLTIRKFTRKPLQAQDLVRFGTLPKRVADFLDTCVKARKNVIISGGTGSGKTTTLNVISGFIPTEERIITIEDAAELKLAQPHVVGLEARPPNIEGKGAITIRELVRNALRMRPDRIVVGECRGGEALDMLQAMNTGHEGSLTTVHANGPRDALARLETMVLMSGMELPIRAIRDQIASAADIVLQQSRFPDGSRRVTHVSEVTGMEGDVISMQDIFVFEQQGFDDQGKVVGELKPTGVVPKFYESLTAMGLHSDFSIFQE